MRSVSPCSKFSPPLATMRTRKQLASICRSGAVRSPCCPSLLRGPFKAVLLPAEMYKDERNKYLDVAQRLKLATGPYQVS